MTDSSQTETPAGLKLTDVYFIVFRRKWLILGFVLTGAVAAATMLYLNPPVYQSSAKLFIRYVVTGKSLNAPGGDQNARSLNDQEAGIITTELEILKSFDLARQTALSIGPEKILEASGGGTNVERAASMVMRNLIVDPQEVHGSVLTILCQHPRPDMCQEILSKAILVYYKKHAEAHQPVGVFGDFLLQETKRLQDQLAETDQQLREARNKAGVTSLADARKSFADQSSKIQMDIFNAEADLAARQSLADQQARAPVLGSMFTNAEPAVAADTVEEYRSLCARLELFRRREQEFQLSFTESNSLVQEVHNTVRALEARRATLEVENPRLSNINVGVTPGPIGLGMMDDGAGTLQIRALTRRIETLKAQMKQVQQGVTKLDEMETHILDLQRKKDLQEGDLKYFSAKLEQGKIDEALGSGEAPNIDIVDPPTPPVKARPKKFNKILAIIGIAPVAAGFGLAFLIELFLDTSVKRPGEVEKKLRMPLMISIPHTGRNGRSKGPHAGSPRSPEGVNEDGEVVSNGVLEVAPWEADNPLRRYYEGLRDRLIVYFEVNKLLHKPKMIAVTGCNQGAGVTSLAAGLAASLSETGDGNVLYVDMNRANQGESQQFYKGKPACELEDALEGETKEDALVQPNLYVATAPAGDDLLPRVLPKRFTQLMPKFRASQYDYIIFDMPPVSQTSVTPRLAGLMDMILLVVEAERNTVEVVHQAHALLEASKANVGVVLNKTQSYVPSVLQPQLGE